jgi:hypothetical protein
VKEHSTEWATQSPLSSTYFHRDENGKASTTCAGISNSGEWRVAGKTAPNRGRRNSGEWRVARLLLETNLTAHVGTFPDAHPQNLLGCVATHGRDRASGKITRCASMPVFELLRGASWSFLRHVGTRGKLADERSRRKPEEGNEVFKNALRCMSSPLGHRRQRVLHCIIRWSEQALPIHPCSRARWPTYSHVAALPAIVVIRVLLSTRYCLLSTVYFWGESLGRLGQHWPSDFRHGSKRGQAPLCAAPFGPFRQRCLTPF